MPRPDAKGKAPLFSYSKLLANPDWEQVQIGLKILITTAPAAAVSAASSIAATAVAAIVAAIAAAEKR
jgi:hypothetical protein